MNKYIITKDVEVGVDYFEGEDVGVFDTEEEAMQKAKNYYEEMPDHEKQYYSLIVWKATGESLDANDWETFEECESIEVYEAKAIESADEREAEDPYTFGWDQTTAHFCVLPAQDRARVWVGNDPDRYVDRAYSRDSFDLAHALEEWFKQHGRIAEEDWREKYPERSRKMYLEYIIGKGYSDKEAEEIMHYLPRTIGDQISDNVTTMIELWKSKANVVTPYRAPAWKKKCSGNKAH